MQSRNLIAEMFHFRVPTRLVAATNAGTNCGGPVCENCRESSAIAANTSSDMSSIGTRWRATIESTGAAARIVVERASNDCDIGGSGFTLITPAATVARGSIA